MKCVIEIHQSDGKITVVATVPKEAEDKVSGILTNTLVKHADQILKLAFEEASIQLPADHQ